MQDGLFQGPRLRHYADTGALELDIDEDPGLGKTLAGMASETYFKKLFVPIGKLLDPTSIEFDGIEEIERRPVLIKKNDRGLGLDRFLSS